MAVVALETEGMESPSTKGSVGNVLRVGEEEAPEPHLVSGQ